MSEYDVNWIKTPAGNGIHEGDELIVTVHGAKHVSFGIYVAGLPVLASFGLGSTAKIKVSRRDLDLSGPAVLKVRAWSGSQLLGWNDEFFIL